MDTYIFPNFFLVAVKINQGVFIENETSYRVFLCNKRNRSVWFDWHTTNSFCRNEAIRCIITTFQLAFDSADQCAFYRKYSDANKIVYNNILRALPNVISTARARRFMSQCAYAPPSFSRQDYEKAYDYAIETRN